MNPSQVGAVAETAIAAEATRCGFDVYRPVADGGRCDLVFDVAGQLLRVQCKTAVNRGDVLVIDARTSRRTRTGHLRGVYTAEEVDVIAAFAPELDRSFAIPTTDFPAGGCLRLRLAPSKNGQRAGLHFAEDYALGAVAQLAERLAGSEEARGSNPLSSTSCDGAATVVGAHEFRNRFGWYMERAAAGESILVTRRGKPHLRLSAAETQTRLAA